MRRGVVRAASSHAAAAAESEEAADDDVYEETPPAQWGKAPKLLQKLAGSRAGPFARSKGGGSEQQQQQEHQHQPRQHQHHHQQQKKGLSLIAKARSLRRAPPEGPADNYIGDELPRWCTFAQSIDVWYAELVSFDVDEIAQKELVLLSQLSERGYQEANAILGKLLKKQADGVFVGNASGFVHACVNNARALIARQEGTSFLKK